ncbi:MULTISPECIES: hypothetical protein [Citrobacter]|nr:hypothetical protein [Citrobacter braakii]
MKNDYSPICIAETGAVGDGPGRWACWRINNKVIRSSKAPE